MHKTHKTQNQKKTVRYCSTIGQVQVGKSCTLFPLDHPDTYNVSNEGPAYTSKVLSYDQESGTIETMNTIYVLDKNAV